MRLIYHPEAEAELIGAAEYYEHRLPGLGALLTELFARLRGLPNVRPSSRQRSGDT